MQNYLMTTGLCAIVPVLNTYFTALTTKSTLIVGLCTNVLADSSNNCHCLTLSRFLVVAFPRFFYSHLLLPLLFPFYLLNNHLLLIVLLLFLETCVCNSVVLLICCFFVFSLQCLAIIPLDIPFFCKSAVVFLTLTCLSGC
jgi:hypothetical protein